MIGEPVNTVRKRGKNAECISDVIIYSDIQWYVDIYSDIVINYSPPVEKIEPGQYQENLPQVRPGEANPASPSVKTDKSGQYQENLLRRKLGNSGGPVVEKKSCGIDHSTGSAHDYPSGKKVSYS